MSSACEPRSSEIPRLRKSCSLFEEWDTRPVPPDLIMGRILLFFPRALRRTWRRSLFIRVTSTTLVLSIVVVAALGLLLLSNVTTGLLEAKERSAVGEASAGLGEAQRLLDAADTGPSTPSPARLVDSVVTSLATRAGSPATSMSCSSQHARTLEPLSAARTWWPSRASH